MRPLLFGLVLAGLSIGLIACGGQTEDADHFSSGLKLQEEERFDEAIAQFDVAIQDDPSQPEAYFQRGLAYDDLGEYEQAIQDYTEAIRLNPKYVEAHSERGGAFINLGDLEKAMRDVEEAIRLDPSYPLAHNNQGGVFFNQGLSNHAIEAYVNLAVANTLLGRDDEARRNADKAIELGLDGAFLTAELAKLRDDR